MAGMPMRLGGHNAVREMRTGGDGCPESPWELSPVATRYFRWLSEQLRDDEPESVGGLSYKRNSPAM